MIFSVGDFSQLSYPRSAMKFFQQIPLIAKGGAAKFDLSLEEIALLCGSHNGEKKHVETVKKMLGKMGLSESDLECGPQMPTMSADKNELIKSGQKASPIHNNCSGKHTGFLLLAKLLGVDTKDYINPNHPTQQLIAETCSRFYETQQSETPLGMDGCSAPVFAYTLKQQAIAYLNLINPIGFDDAEKEACETLCKAVTTFPFMIAGSKRYCTELMEVAGERIVGKTGADGVYCLAIPSKKWGIAIKIDDGKMGPQYTVAQALLWQSGLLGESECTHLNKYMIAENRNWAGRNVGEIRINPEINLKIQ